MVDSLKIILLLRPTSIRQKSDTVPEPLSPYWDRLCKNDDNYIKDFQTESSLLANEIETLIRTP